MNRLHEFRKLLSERYLEGFFTASIPNITYLTGFKGDSSRLLVSQNRAVLITDGRYTEQAKNECSTEVEIFKWIDNKRYASETYSQLVKEFQVKTLGIEGNALSVAEFETLQKSALNIVITNNQGLTEKLRAKKTSEEIEYLRKACMISDTALEKTLPFIKEGITELEVVAQLEYQLKMNGAENLSFDTMVLSGTKTSLLHGKPGNKKLAKGYFVLFDFGALFGGYHADISRTFMLGSPSAQQKEMYQVILEAQNAAVSAIKPGITSKELDALVRSILPAKYHEYYYPGLGHGVGLEIHETPFLGRDYEATLEVNNVITIEPGIYIPEFGGLRIEDTVWVQQNKAGILSQFPKELMIF
jgi:Xaa-Pro aminopeptidase